MRTSAALTPGDRLAQAGLTVQCARRALVADDWLLARARYRVAGTPVARLAKETEALVLATWVARQRGVSVDEYGVDATREWCGLRPAAGVREWSRRLDVHKSTLHRWRYAPYRPGRRQGILSLLNDRHEQVMSTLRIAFEEVGIC